MERVAKGFYDTSKEFAKHLMVFNFAELEKLRLKLFRPFSVIDTLNCLTPLNQFLANHCPEVSIKYCIAVGYLDISPRHSPEDPLVGLVQELLKQFKPPPFSKLRIVLEHKPNLIRNYTIGNYITTAMINVLCDGKCEYVSAFRELVPNHSITVFSELQYINHICPSCMEALFPRGVIDASNWLASDSVATLIKCAKKYDLFKELYLSQMPNATLTAKMWALFHVERDNMWIYEPLKDEVYNGYNMITYMQRHRRYNQTTLNGLEYARILCRVLKLPGMLTTVMWSGLTDTFCYDALRVILDTVPESIIFDKIFPDDMFKYPQIARLLGSSTLEEQWTCFLKCEKKHQEGSALAAQVFWDRVPRQVFKNVEFQRLLCKKKNRKDLRVLRGNMIQRVAMPLLIGQMKCVESPLSFLDTSVMQRIVGFFMR